jgi:hypothetical protein
MTITADDYAERQAVIKACSTLVERLKSILQTPTQEQSAKVALWRLGLEQAIGISGRGARFVGLRCGGNADRSARCSWREGHPAKRRKLRSRSCVV